MNNNIIQLNFIKHFTELIQNGLSLHLPNTNKYYKNEEKINSLIENISDKEIFSKFDDKQIQQLNNFLLYKKYEISLFLSKKIYQRYENYKVENDTNEILMLELIDFINKFIICIQKMEINFDCQIKLNLSKFIIIYFIKCVTSIIYTILIEKNLFAIKYIETLFDFYEQTNELTDISNNNNLINKIKNKII